MTAGKVLVLGAIGLLLYVAHAAFTPIALALLFALILSSPVEALHRWRVPRAVSALLILILSLSLALAGGAIDLVWKPAQHWFATAPETPTLFLLAGGPPMLARMTSAFVDDLHAGHVLEVIGKVRAEVGRFYITTTAINIGLGIATAAVMMAWSMPNPYLWGFLAATLNYFPFVGPGTTLLVITVVAIVSFTDLGRIAGIAGSFVALVTLEGQIVQPLLVGRRLAVNPLVVFLSLWFGGLFWGIAGIILATPTLVAIKVVAANSARGAALLEFLGPNKEVVARERKLRRFARSIGD